MPRNLIPSEVRDFTEEQPVEQLVLEGTDQQDLQDIYLAKAREMILLREQKAQLEEIEAGLKKELMAILEKEGHPYGPEGQHRTLEFPAPIRNIVRFVRQSKVSQGVNAIEAEAIARRKGLFDRLFVPVPTLDQDAVMVAVAEGLITEREMAQMFPKKTSYAFTVEKEKK